MQYTRRMVHEMTEPATSTTLRVILQSSHEVGLSIFHTLLESDLYYWTSFGTEDKQSNEQLVYQMAT
jgi:hypothetical protein